MGIQPKKDKLDYQHLMFFQTKNICKHQRKDELIYDDLCIPGRWFLKLELIVVLIHQKFHSCSAHSWIRILDKVTFVNSFKPPPHLFTKKHAENTLQILGLDC